MQTVGTFAWDNCLEMSLTVLNPTGFTWSASTQVVHEFDPGKLDGKLGIFRVLRQKSGYCLGVLNQNLGIF